MIDRRTFLAAAAIASAAGALRLPAARAAEEPAPDGIRSFEDVALLARARAQEEHRPSAITLRAPYADLSYDRFRSIRVPAEERLFANSSSAFEVDLLPPGNVYRDRIEINVIRPGSTERLDFSSQHFNFDPETFGFPDGKAPQRDDSDLSYSGFRLRYGINRPDVLDEFLVFQGASYFRAVARGLSYGISARGLSIRTADPRGEEFPVFTAFWIVEPGPDDREINIFALLESPSCTGAYAFRIAPGASTLMETRVRLFPRVELQEIGIAPLTSMYYFSPESRAGVDDFREAVHDSDGLQMITGAKRRLWRPLTNPRRVEISAFQDENPRGFGLVQRSRDFADYQDAEARYDLRPSAWVEPVGDWGKGAVVLVEIPVDNEFNDNIVAFWRPAQELGPSDTGHAYAYRLHWTDMAPDAAPLARVRATRAGRSITSDDRRRFAVDFSAPEVPLDRLTANVSASAGEATDVHLVPLPGGPLIRVSFQFAPGDAQSSELFLALESPDGPASETWLYRWTPE